MVERDLGEATIVYEDPSDGTVEQTVENEHVAYFQDHWIVRVGESEAGDDEIRRIPANRVFYVERSVEEFEEEVSTVADQLRSVTDELRQKLPVGGGRGGDRRSEGREGPIDIEVEGEPAADTARGGEPEDVDTSTSESGGTDST